MADRRPLRLAFGETRKQKSDDQPQHNHGRDGFVDSDLATSGQVSQHNLARA